MKERPILFSAPMVIEILAGTKTQTRRVVNWKQIAKQSGCSRGTLAYSTAFKSWAVFGGGDADLALVTCPYGADGDRLWVKETFRVNGTMAGPRVTYRADECELWPKGCPDNCDDWIADDNHWRPSIFMRRYASRLTLEITNVRVERLNGISEADAEAEGMAPWHAALGAGMAIRNARERYEELWESINGPGSWAKNPWVWVIEFKRCEGEK